MAIKVVLAIDNTIVREGLKLLLARKGIAVIGEAADDGGALRQVLAIRPEVAVLDLAMSNRSGLDAARAIMEKSPCTKTILLTQHVEKQFIIEALRAGVNGYVLKTEGMSDLLQAIGEVSRGRLHLSPSIWSVLIEAYAAEAAFPPESLTPREREVLHLIVEGKSNKRVAKALGISARTAESHRSRIMGKLEIHDVAGLVRYAIRRGLIQP